MVVGVDAEDVAVMVVEVMVVVILVIIYDDSQGLWIAKSFNSFAFLASKKRTLDRRKNGPHEERTNGGMDR